ncbi:MAG: TonB-dependent receptor [Nitrospira sp.]|nr:TonB-dependent receptor [Nitrospira sp.]
MSAEVALFRTEFSNQIVQQGSQFVNAGKTLMEGIESTVSLDWGEIVRPLQGFVTRGSITLLRRNRCSERPLGKTFLYPTHDVLQVGGYYHPTGASIEADAMYIAQQFTDGKYQAENAWERTAPSPSYTIWNLQLNYAPPKAESGRFSPACVI